MRRSAPPNCRGFTLVELIAVIVIIGILAALTGTIITRPVEGFGQLEGRAQVTDMADGALRLMAREVRAALPNSVRVTTGPDDTLEFIHTIDGARYRTANASAAGILTIGAPDREFDLVGGFYQATPLAGGIVPRLVVYNTGTTALDVPYNAYLAAGDAGNMTAADNTVTLGALGSGENPGEQHITLLRPHTFPAPGSGNVRIFLVDHPITYTCRGGTLMRYEGYTIANPTAVPPGDGTSAPVATGAECHFTYNAGTATRAGVLTMSLRLTAANGEWAMLLRQVHVDNLP